MNNRTRRIPMAPYDINCGAESSCVHCGSTGNVELDGQLIQLARDIPGVKHPELLAEMLVSSVRAARSGISTADFKLMNRSWKEMLNANELFSKWDQVRKVSVFGSARIKPGEPAYKAAYDFSAKMREAGFMVITGAGPGIMQAGNEGAGTKNSFGLGINLPFEVKPNHWIDEDEKLLKFNYFFTRKLMFVKESDAVACFAGGFGTMDEVFETLTLIQTGKAPICPLVMIDHPGKTFWTIWKEFVTRELLESGLICKDDFSLFMVTQDVDEAVEEITGFYRNFHSYRYVGSRLSICMHHPLGADQIAELNADFRDILVKGEIEQQSALPQEEDVPELSEKPRLVLRFAKGKFGRLRQLINRINQYAVSQ